MLLKKKNYGIVFWITGLSGSGKTTIAKKIHKKISEHFGPTILINGDDLREIFSLKGYSYKQRLNIGKKYSKFCKKITYQKINIIITVIGMFDELRKINKIEIKNYCEIYLDTNIKKIKKFRKKSIYLKEKKNIFGEDILAEFPKKPHITIKNDFKTDINVLARRLEKKILSLKNL